MLKLCFLILLVSSNVALASNDPSTLDNIKLMDQNNDGIISFSEMRTHIELTNGKYYLKELLDNMEEKYDSRSCGSSFSGGLY